MNRNFLRFRCYFQPYNARRFFKNTSKIDPEELAENEPVKFSTSPAAQRTVKPIVRRNLTQTKMPWYQPYSVSISVAIFLLYFCVFREENDVDQEFTKTLYSRIKGLEKEQLLQSYRFNKEHGKSVAEIEARLKEIEEQEQNAKLVTIEE